MGDRCPRCGASDRELVAAVSHAADLIEMLAIVSRPSQEKVVTAHAQFFTATDNCRRAVRCHGDKKNER